MPRLASRSSLMVVSFGPIVWGIHFLWIYSLVGLVCARYPQTTGAIWLGIGIGTAAALVAAALPIAFARRDRSEEGQPEADRRRFMARATLFLCLLSLVGILWDALPILLTQPCR